MGVFDNQQSEGNWVFAPKQGGESLTVTVTGELQRVNTDNNNKNNYKKLVNGNQENFGYYDLLEVEGDKKLMINTWKLYFALKECNPDIGDVITISHPDRGVYTITK